VKNNGKNLCRSFWVCLLLVVFIATLSSADAKVKTIASPEDIETIRFLGANNVPVKVLVAYAPEQGNENFVVSLINIVANMQEKGWVPKDCFFKVHVIPTASAKSSDFAGIRKKVSAELLKKYVEFSSTDVSNDMWMQDWGEVGVVKLKSEKKPQLVVFDSNRGRGNTYLTNELANFWNCYVLTNPSTARSGGDYGGNIEVTPDNVLLIGDTSTPQLREYLEKHGYAGRMAVLETSWLHVGHVDEYISVCPNAKAARGYTLIKSNPRLALRLIKDASLEELNAIPHSDYRDVSIKIKNYLQEAEAIRAKHKLSGGRNAGVPEEHKFSQAVLEYLDRSAGDDGMPLVNRSSGVDLASGHSVDKAEIEEFIKLNLTLANVIDSNVKKACAKISEVRKETGKAHSVLSFPAMYRKMRSDKHIAYFPGSVNQLILNNQLIVPDPQVESMRRNIARSASMIGLKANFIDSIPYHNLQGQLHCGTNVFRHPNKYFVKPR